MASSGSLGFFLMLLNCVVTISMYLDMSLPCWIREKVLLKSADTARSAKSVENRRKHQLARRKGMTASEQV